MTQDNTPFEGTDADDIQIDLGPHEETDLDDFDIDLGFGETVTASDDDVLANLAGGDEEEDQAEAEASADAAAAEEAVLEELRQRLRSQPGDWYVVHTYSGMENRVKQNLDSRVKSLGMEEFICESIAPTEDVV